MTIKNLDGSTFKLQGPNPVAAEQSTWDDFHLHNMEEWEGVEIPDKSVVKQYNSDFKIKDLGSVQAVIEVPIPGKPKPKPKPTPKKLKNSVVMWCLPARIKKSEDKYEIFYYDKVTFEAVILHNDGFNLAYWTNVDVSQPGSIVFPRSNSEGHSLNNYEWWKVDKIIGPDEDERLQQSGGLIYYCVPSEYTPDFTD